MSFIPFVLEQNISGERSYDIYSRLLQDRIIILTGEINDSLSSVVIGQLLYLDTVSHDDIYLYINSPGGSITAGMAIYDTMNYINSKVSTICIGMAMSMGAFLLAAGAKGKRYALENSEIMIHQPLGGMQGQVTDIDIQARRLIKTRNTMNRLLSQNTGQSIDKVSFDTERDYFMDSLEAKDYGIIDSILIKKVKE